MIGQTYKHQRDWSLLRDPSCCAHGEWSMFEGASGGVALVAEARLKPNDLT